MKGISQNLISMKVKINGDLFHARVKYRIGTEMGSSHTITKDDNCRSNNKVVLNLNR